MTIVEINQLPNGAHRNQSGAKSVPEDWAVVPDSLATPNFPFGDLEAEEVNEVMTVTSWTALPVPQPEPEEPDPLESIDAMLVDHEYRLTLMELGITEMEV